MKDEGNWREEEWSITVTKWKWGDTEHRILFCILWISILQVWVSSYLHWNCNWYLRNRPVWVKNWSKICTVNSMCTK